MEERFRVVEGFDVYDFVRAAEICLILNVMIPKELRVPEFVKYTELECPNTHLRSYYNKIMEVIYNDKLFIHFFKDSLTGFVLNWYMTLDNTRVKKWSDLVDAFLRQYKFNIDIALEWTSLIVMEKGNKEIVRGYAHRWKKIMTLFANTFKSPYYEYLMGSFTQHFYDVVVIVARIE